MRYFVIGFAILAVMLGVMSDQVLSEKPEFRWQRPTPVGKPTKGRHGNSATLVDSEMFVIGGCDSDISCSSDVSVYNTDTRRWETLYSDADHARVSLSHDPAIVIPPRGYHTAVALPSAAPKQNNKKSSRIYVMGGQSSEGFRKDVYVFDTASRAWSKPLVSGHAPTERAGHSAVVYKNRIIVYGGNTEDGFVNDLWQFDTKLNAWSQLKTQGAHAPTSAFHSAVVVGNHMWVFGGRNDKAVLGDKVYVLDLDIMTWQKPLIHGKAPAKRHGVNASVYKNRYVFLTGGCDISLRKCYDDTFTLDTETQTWVRPVLKHSVIVNANEATAAGVAPAAKPTTTHKASFLETGASVDEEAELDLEAEDEVSFVQVDQELARSDAVLSSDVRRVGNTLYVSDLSQLDSFFANMKTNKRVASHEAHAAATEEMSFADSANVTIANATAASPNATAPASAPVVANATAATAAVNKTAPAPVPVVVANATVANATVAVSNATIATPKVNATAPTANVTVAHVKPVTINTILKQTNTTVKKGPAANLKGIASPKSVSSSSLPKILGLKGMVDAEAAKQKLKKEVEKEKKKTDAATSAHNFTPVLKPHAGADFVGSFKGDQLILFGGCGLANNSACGEGVLVMHVDPKTPFQIGLF